MEITAAQTRALAEIRIYGVGPERLISSAIPIASFPIIRSLERLGLLEWTRTPERRESIAPAGWTGRVTVEWLYSARLTPAGLAALEAPEVQRSIAAMPS